MVSAATQVAIEVAKWIFRLGFIVAGVVAFVVLLNLGLSFFFVALNATVLADLFALLQMWLPFNLNALLGWVVAASAAYIVYRLAVIAIAYLNKLIGD